MIHAGILRRIRGRTGSLWPSVSGSRRLHASGGRLRSSAPQFAALPILHARTRDHAHAGEGRRGLRRQAAEFSEGLKFAGSRGAGLA